MHAPSPRKAPSGYPAGSAVLLLLWRMLQFSVPPFICSAASNRNSPALSKALGGSPSEAVVGRSILKGSNFTLIKAVMDKRVVQGALLCTGPTEKNCPNCLTANPDLLYIVQALNFLFLFNFLRSWSSNLTKRGYIWKMRRASYDNSWRT